MRSADLSPPTRPAGAPRPFAAAATGIVALMLGGCAAMPWPFGAGAGVQAPAAPAPAQAAAPVAPPTPEQAASAPAAAEPARPLVAEAAPAAAATPAAPPLAPIDASTQAAFDEAVRTLRGGRLSEAEKAFTRLAQQRPDLAGVHANLGLVHRRLGRLEQSATELQEAVRLSPRQAAFHNQLGVTWRALGRFDHARKAYETAIELDPAHAGALINLAILHDIYLGEPARAAELYTRGAALLPGEAATINKWLAELKNRKADPKLAASAAAAPRKEKE